MNVKELAMYITEHSGDIGTLTAPEWEYEQLLTALLQPIAKEAYFDGWSDARNTTVCDGDPTHDWIDSDTFNGRRE